MKLSRRLAQRCAAMASAVATAATVGLLPAPAAAAPGDVAAEITGGPRVPTRPRGPSPSAAEPY